MSLNVLNKKFISLLCHIGVDTDVFPDKTFDGLFERRHNELNYFLEWFVDNITSENSLTEAEMDIYHYLKACKLSLSDEELNFALVNWTPSYEDLEFTDENYINTSLVGELEGINKEYELLKSINFDLEKNYSELRKKPNLLKQECNRTRKKLEQKKDNLQVLNSNFSFMNEDICNFKLSNCSDVMDLSKFKNSAEEEEKLAEIFSGKNHQCDQIIDLLNGKSDGISKLKMNLKTSKYCCLVSKSLLEEAKYKTSRAEDFLNKLKDESDKLFTFEEILSIWFDLSELNTYDNLLEEIHSMEVKDLMVNLEKECELIWHNFLSHAFYHKLCDNNSKISNNFEFLKHIKLDIVNNKLLQLVVNRSKEKEKELADSVNGYYCFLNKNQNNIKNTIENILYKNKKTQDYFRNLNEKHSLFLSCKRNLAHLMENNVDCDKDDDAVKFLIDSPYFYPEEVMHKLGITITSRMANILCGPTNQIKMIPIEIKWELNKCDKLLAEYSHSIQRLLTKYVNTKESVSSSNRRQLLLWIDFLINPDVLTAELKQLQEKSIKCTSKLRDL